MKRASIRASLLIIVVALVAGVVAYAGLLPSYWVFLATSVLITGVALQSLGLVAGRTGMIALCQMSFAGVGAWTVGYLNIAEAPGGLAAWVLAGGLAAVPFGVAIGLPALRLRGINLAIVTLSFATAFDTILATITYPGQTDFLQVPRPELFDTDEGYFVFVLLFYAGIAIALEFLSRSRLGAAWLAVRHSERAAAAHGVRIATAKLSAFAISAFVAGISGGLLAGYLGTLVSDNFGMMQSLSLYAVAVMTGAHFAEGAIIGGLLVVMFPEILRRLDWPQDIGNVLFAVGATQALSTGETMSETFRRQLRKLLPAHAPKAAKAVARELPPAVRHAAGPALAIEGLTVRYGSVVALNDVSLTVAAGTVAGLIGPNGAGKSTFIDAVAGFLPAYEGRIRLAGKALEGMAAHRRAREGARRTWQTNRIAPELTVGGYLVLAAKGLSASETRALLDWLDCPHPDTPVVSVDAGTRRLLDVAGVVAARPAVVLLDEPAAGQSHEETLRLGQRIAEIPKLFGSAVLLVEHDMDLVRAVCSEVTVLDFGQVIASGPPARVLEQGAVKKAYLGIEEESAAA
ncbi:MULTISPECIES: ATP-binding cassette domain-containing protein [unclassified Mesorhizobium]|uniref:branched-chain amino acid ABC transporter ATP-binding protein/permease n=1 Tax=unclassified Mesorhizobium TaxID=325217 RepID=UPI00096059E5|nr:MULTISPECIES: ATP-binding cassette domain-containing protein [unclassified Mesorhizobium]MBN9253605.1 branched-chain amino acid ABC transporter ATP-binding protein/permease [Mesorhizobium sp.]OJX81981.1 MAG: branched-chain amino acid ABC transporter ATP-binding protein [Mesorhizobium sp. 65-26]